MTGQNSSSPVVCCRVFLRVFMAKEKKDEKVDMSRECFPCGEVGETALASSWWSDCDILLCLRCSNMHSKVRETEHHDVYSLSGDVTRTLRPVCQEHSGEQIKFICKDCNKLLCQTCCILQHRKCKEVVTIESALPEVKSVLQEKVEEMSEKMKSRHESMKKKELNIKEFKQMKKDAHSKIRSSVENIMKSLKAMETKLMGEVDKHADQQIEQDQAAVKSDQITLQTYQQHCEFIQQALNSECMKDILDIYQLFMSGEVKFDYGGGDDYGEHINSVKFEVNRSPIEIPKFGQVIVNRKTEEYQPETKVR